jgi:catechol 2,3-dioxygenase-like lactoylglutathione lyase family enzyme
MNRWLASFLLWFVTAGAHALGVDAIGITVSDADRSTAFYRDVLGFVVIEDREVAGDDVERLFGVFGARVRAVRMALGEERIELMEWLAPHGRPYPVDMRSNDRAFQHIAIVVSDMSTAYRVLRNHRVTHASTGPQRLPDWNPNAGGIEAFYFRDPDGNFLELIRFPAGKGRARWQHAEGRVFLGIDHTAVVVADTEASIAFYRDRLGFEVAGHGENWGTEQEHLNNVFGARLRITALLADDGPGVELLEYLAPAGGRPMPADTAANDLWFWHVQIVPDALDPTRAVVLADRSLGYGRGQLVRDPDGHASLLVADTGAGQ